MPELNDVMTIDDLAVYLKVPKSTLYKLVRGGQIPCQKVGRHWRFRRESINQWLDRNNARGSDGKTS